MQHKTEYDYLFKIVVMGDPGSGKTWFIRRIIDELIPDVQNQPLGTDFKIKTITDPETNKIIKFQIWKKEIHREERLHNGHAGGFRGALGIIITVDVTSRPSLNNLKHCFQIVERFAAEHTKVLVMATKSDDSQKRSVWNEEILELVEEKKQEEYWQDHDLQFIETSAKNDYNVSQALQTISRSILLRVMGLDTNNRPTITITPDVNTNKKEKPKCTVM